MQWNSLQIFLLTLELQRMVRERDNLNRRDLCLGNWVLSGLFPGLRILDLVRDFENMRSCRPALDHIQYETVWKGCCTSELMLWICLLTFGHCGHVLGAQGSAHLISRPALVNVPPVGHLTALQKDWLSAETLFSAFFVTFCAGTLEQYLVFFGKPEEGPWWGELILWEGSSEISMI